MTSENASMAPSPLTPPDYTARIAERNAGRILRTARAMLIEGPKGCGKTWLAQHFAQSQALLEQDAAAFALAQAEPQRVLEGATPRLIDEWQRVPEVWGAVRGMCDARAEPGQFILTGSATPSDEITRHSGALRIQRLRLRPMSLAEQGLSTQGVSLAALLDGGPARAEPTGRGLPEAVEALCRGGWPGLGGEMGARDVLSALRSYLDDIARIDIAQVDGVSRDPRRVAALIRSLARNIGTLASLNKLADEAGGGAVLSRHAVRSYLDALERLHVSEPLTSWPTHLRSRSPLLKSPRHHFVDPSLAVAALRTQPERLLADRETLGLLFESLVLRDLRIYAQAADAEVFAFRDRAGYEVDTVVDAGDGRWIAVEVKLGGEEQVEAGARSLVRIHDKVDESKVGRAAKLVVITAADGYAYERPDGVSVVPIFALGP